MQAASDLVLLLLFIFPAKGVKGQHKTDAVVHCKLPEQIEAGQNLTIECQLDSTRCNFNIYVACYDPEKKLLCELKTLGPGSDGRRSVEIQNVTLNGTYDVAFHTDCGTEPKHRFEVNIVIEAPEKSTLKLNTESSDETLTKALACVGCVLGAGLVVLVVLGIRRKKKSRQCQQTISTTTNWDCEAGVG